MINDVHLLYFDIMVDRLMDLVVERSIVRFEYVQW